MTTLTPLSDTTAQVSLLDRARAALHLRQASPAARAARAEGVQRRNEARAVRAHRLAVARFGEHPAGPAAGSLARGAWRD